MSDQRTTLQTSADPDETAGDLLRARALASSPQFLVAQAAAGVALNAAVLVWHPERWGIATAAVAAVALHALWALAVQRTTDVGDAIENEKSEGEHAPGFGAWWLVRRASAIGATASALLLLWFVCMMLLGRLIS